MKKISAQFAAAVVGALAGAVAYAQLWQHIDRFFYEAFGIVLQCDGCSGPALSLLYGFIPVAAALCTAVCTRVFYDEAALPLLLGSLFGSVFLGGTMSLLAVQVAQGFAAAAMVACAVAATATAGAVFGPRIVTVSAK